MVSDQATTAVVTEEASGAENPTPTTPEVTSADGAAPQSILSEPVPEAFDPEAVTLPEGMTKDDALFGEFVELAKTHKLNGPMAEALLGLGAKQAAALAERQQAVWNKQIEEWQAEVRADKEIGGDKLQGVLQTFSKAASDLTLSDPGFREALAFTGAGNHPAIVRTLAKWAAALSEGGPVRGGPTAGNGRTPQTLGEAIYGTGGPHAGGPKLN